MVPWHLVALSALRGPFIAAACGCLSPVPVLDLRDGLAEYRRDRLMGDNLGASDIETVTVQLAGLLLTISVSPLQSGDSPPESQTGYSSSRVARAVGWACTHH